MTIFWAVRILPPPTGMSVVLARTAGPPAPDDAPPPAPDDPAPAAGEDVVGWAGGPASPLLVPYRAHPASVAAHAAQTPPSTARRLDDRTSGLVMTVSSAVDSEGGKEPEGRREPQSDQEREHHRSRHGKRPAGESALGQDQHLDGERAEERAAKQRVDQDPGAVGLESERVEAVHGDRYGQEECDPAGPLVQYADPRWGGDTRDLAVHHQGRGHLDDREHGSDRGEPRLHIARAREPRDIDHDAGRLVQAAVDAQGQCHQPADQAGHD